MASANVMLSLPQMVDLAINYPEGGSVNFSMLHSVLQVVIQQLELLSCNVEFRGKDGDRVQGLLDVKKKAPQTFNLAEYIVTPAKDAGKLVSRKRRRGKKKDDDKVIHIDDIPSEEDLQTVVVVDTDHITDKTTSVEPTIISSEKIDKIQEDVNKLKQVVTELVEMPANQTIIDAMRKSVDGTTSSNPVLEMFQSISLSKRMDAAEAGMLKLASMMEDLFKVNPEMGASNVSAVEGALSTNLLLAKALSPSDNLRETITSNQRLLGGHSFDPRRPSWKANVTPAVNFNSKVRRGTVLYKYDLCNVIPMTTSNIQDKVPKHV